MAAKKGKESLIEISIKTETIVRVILIVLAFALAYYLRDIVALVLVALLLSALIDPFTQWLKRYKIPRPLSVIGIYLVLLSLLAGVIYLIVPPTAQQTTQLAEKYAPELAALREDSHIIDQILSGEVFHQNVSTIISQLEDAGISEAVPKALDLLTTAFGGILSVFLVFILAFYMIVERNRIKKSVEGWPVKQVYKDFLFDVIPKVRTEIGAWLRGQLIVMFAVFLLVYVALSLIGVPFALVLALVAGLLEVIPFLGPNLSAIPAILIALSVSPGQALLVALVYFGIQQIEADVLSPKVFQSVAGLNPIVTIVAILIGFQIGGIAGGLLAIPFTMVLSVLLKEGLAWFNEHRT